jgi:hypothetical protein
MLISETPPILHSFKKVNIFLSKKVNISGYIVDAYHLL